MSDIYFLAIFTIIGAVLYQAGPVRYLAGLGILTLSYVIDKGLCWLLCNLRPRRIIHCNDKAVLITGCDSGFGRALAERLDRLGFKVYAGCFHLDGQGAQELKSKTSERLHLVQLDVTNQDQIDAVYHFVTSSLGVRKLWAIVNNAGVSTCAEIEWCPIDKITRLLDVNSVGPVRVIKTFLPLLRLSKGRIVFVVSQAGYFSVPGLTAYSMSKFAAVGLADGLRREMKKWSVSVHTVDPSFYRTNMLEVNESDPIKENWNETDESIRSAYGEDYLEDFMRTWNNVINSECQPAEKIDQVIDVMVDAVAGVNPERRYVPNMRTQLQVCILNLVPTSWLEAYMHLKFSSKILPAARRAHIIPEERHEHH